MVCAGGGWVAKTGDGPVSYTKEDFELYCVIMRCLHSEAYAGKAFQDKCFQFLDDSLDMNDVQRRTGWEKLHEEYEQLSKPHWQKVQEHIGNRKLRQGELFA